MVASVNVMRPTNIDGLVLSAGSVGTAGGSFYIKAVTARLAHYTPIVEVSGDGDQAPRHLVNYWLYADWIIRGWAVAGQAIGIANLKSTSNNPTGTTLCQFNFAKDSAQRAVKGEFFVHRVVIEWARKSAYVGLVIALKNTCTDADGLANYVEGS